MSGISRNAGRSASNGTTIKWTEESVSQLPLKDKAFLTFPDQNPPFELQPKAGVSPPIFHGIIVALASFSRLHRRCNWECRGSNTTPTLAGIEQPLIVQQTRGLGKIVPAGTHSVTHQIFDPVVAVLRFQERAQGRVYSSISLSDEEITALALPGASVAHAPRKCAAVVRKDHAQSLRDAISRAFARRPSDACRPCAAGAPELLRCQRAQSGRQSHDRLRPVGPP